MVTTRTIAPRVSNRRRHPAVTNWSPLTVLIYEVNLIQLQRQLKGLLKGNFEFRSTRNGIRIVTKEMAHFSTILFHLESNHL
jgi:hypothetical protein